MKKQEKVEIEKPRGFQKGNTYGRKTKPIPSHEIEALNAVIQAYPSIGYKTLGDTAFKEWGHRYSPKKLKDNGVMTENDAVLLKTKSGYISLTKIDSKATPRIDFNKTYNCPLLHSLFPYGFKLENEWDLMLDGSNITEKSLKRAGKSKRSIRFEADANGNCYIKVYGLTSRDGTRRIVLIKSKSTGEPKIHYQQVLFKNKDLLGSGKILILDSQAKLKEIGYNMIVFHPLKTKRHPHNSEVELLFSLLNTRLHKLSSKVKRMNIDDAIVYIQGLIKVIIEKDISEFAGETKSTEILVLNKN